MLFLANTYMHPCDNDADDYDNEDKDDFRMTIDY